MAGRLEIVEAVIRILSNNAPQDIDNLCKLVDQSFAPTSADGKKYLCASPRLAEHAQTRKVLIHLAKDKVIRPSVNEDLSVKVELRNTKRARAFVELLSPQ